MIKLLLFSILAVTMIGLFVPSAFADITILDDATGGDCTTVGTWDAGIRTCTFTSDVSETVVVGANNIALDGNGITIDSGATSFNEACEDPQPYSEGILLEVKTNVIVKNFTIKNFCNAIKFSDSFSNSILDNTLIENYNNIEIVNGINSIITGNTISSTHYTDFGHAIRNDGHGQTTPPLIENNIISGTYYGITTLDHAIIKNNIIDNVDQIGINSARSEISYNAISNTENTAISVGYYGSVHHNTLTNNGLGIDNGECCTEIFENDFINNEKGIQDASTNYTYHNSFLSNTVSAIGNDNVFENQQQTSGNYWSDYSPLCDDDNNDNFCDDPYPFSGGSIMVNDNHVWKIDNGWLTQINTPDDTTIEASDNSGAVVNYSSVTATHDGSVMSVTCDIPSGETFSIGTTNVICTAENGMQSTFSVTTTLETTPPVVIVPDDILINLLESETESIVEFTATATDNVGVSAGPTCSAESGSAFQIGTTTITCTADDAAGNIGAAKFDIIVTEHDSIAPTVTLPISTTLYETASNGGAIATFSVSATDNVGVTVDPTCSHASGSTFPVGITTITCTAEDANGNVGTANLTITVVEYTLPVLPSLTESNTRFTYNDNTISEISINQQVQITTDLLNDQISDQPFAYWITYTGPQSDEMWITGGMAAGQSVSPSLSWTPTVAGTYTFTINVVDDMISKNLLSTPSTLEITIPETEIIKPLTLSHPSLMEKVPDWVKNVFIWYADDRISENELINTIKFLINEDILKIDILLFNE